MNSGRIPLKSLLATAALVSTHADAALVHRWSFDDLNDSVGGANLVLNGDATLSGGQLELPGGSPRTNYAAIPGLGSTLSTNPTVTVEAWFTLDQVNNWTKVWMFGIPGDAPGRSYIGFTPRTGLAGNLPKIDFDTTIAEELNTGADAGEALLTGTEYHVVAVFDAANDLMSFYTNGELVDSASMGGMNITQLGVTTDNFLGAAVFYNDPDMDGRINELRIFNHALSADEVRQSYALGPNAIPEPSSAMLALAAAGMTAGLRRRRNSNPAE